MENLSPTAPNNDYRQRLDVYVNKTAEGMKLIERLNQEIPLEFSKSGFDITQQEQINILSIGSGDGEADIEMLKIVNNYILNCIKTQDVVKKHVNIFNRAIEPNQTALDIYKAAVNNLAQELNNASVTFDLSRPRTLEEYILECKDDDAAIQFNIIHLLHCVYFIPDLKTALEHLYEKQLHNKGIIILAFLDVNDLLCTLQNKGHSAYPQLLDRTDEILQIADKNGWKYTTYINEHYFDVSEVFEDTSMDGNLMLDFFVLKSHFRSQGNGEDIEEVFKIIKEHSIYKEDRYFAKKSQRIIFIHNN